MEALAAFLGYASRLVLLVSSLLVLYRFSLGPSIFDRVTAIETLSSLWWATCFSNPMLRAEDCTSTRHSAWLFSPSRERFSSHIFSDAESSRMNEPSIALQVVASVVTFLGSLFFLAGAIGFVRLPDFYARLHAPTKAATLGIPLIAFGSMLLHLGAGFDIWMQDALMILFVFLTVPLSARVLIRAAIARGVPSSPETTGQPAESIEQVLERERDSLP